MEVARRIIGTSSAIQTLIPFGVETNFDLNSMLNQLNCPCCKKPLYLPQAGQFDEDVLEVICAACKSKYALVYLEVLNFASSVEPIQWQRSGQPIKYNRSYKLRALTLNKAIKAINFSTPEQDEELQAPPGDELLLLYTMRGNQLENLVFVINCTTGQVCQSLALIGRARVAGVNAALVTLFGGGLLSIFIPGVILVTTIPSAIAVGVYVMRRKLPKERDNRVLAKLAAEQKLLQYKFTLEQPVETLRQEEVSNQRLIRRLELLQQKMLKVGELYKERAEKIESAIMILEKQLRLIEHLIAGYTRLAEMIDIEYETSRLAEQLPENMDAQILRQLDELKAIEAKKEELALLVNPQKLLSDSIT